MKKTLLLATASLYFTALGCSEPGCPDHQVRVDGQCEPYGTSPSGNNGGAGNAGSGSAAGMPSGGTSDAGGPGAAGSTSTKEAPFDASCTSHSDCGGETDYCGMPPGAPAYCTASGCDTAPDKCPQDWTCTDLGAFIPGEPWICVKPPAVGSGAFGDACATNADCKGETNYCAMSPTEPAYCSVSGCDAEPDLCPEAWSCLDVGQFIPGEPFVCVKPAAM